MLFSQCKVPDISKNGSASQTIETIQPVINTGSHPRRNEFALPSCSLLRKYSHFFGVNVIVVAVVVVVIVVVAVTAAAVLVYS
jgi:hypothetical protein